MHNALKFLFLYNSCGLLKLLKLWQFSQNVCVDKIGLPLQYFDSRFILHLLVRALTQGKNFNDGVFFDIFFPLSAFHYHLLFQFGKCHFACIFDFKRYLLFIRLLHAQHGSQKLLVICVPLHVLYKCLVTECLCEVRVPVLVSLH